ncbi:MAG: HD domain-containing protein [Candidatus Saccharimonadales bacterium]
MVEFGVKPARDEAIALIDAAFTEIGETFRLDPAVTNEMAEEVIEQYSQEGRFHHAVSHLGELVVFTNTFYIDRSGKNRRVLAADNNPKRGALLAMAMWHDFYYDTGVYDADNIRLSADFAAKRLNIAGLEPDAISFIHKGILATAAHRSTEHDPDIAFFLDSDMSILGGPRLRYETYEHDIEKEFTRNWSPDEYRAGRVAFLTKLTKLQNIFNTGINRRRFNGPAKANIARELAKLKTTAQV